MGSFGVTYLDNVKLVEDSLIINGDFSNDFSKCEVFVDSSISSQISSNIDKSNGNNSAQVNIKNTGDADWKIQLKQTGVELVKGKKYKLSLDAKSTLPRNIMFTIQRDGSKDNNTDISDDDNIEDNMNQINEENDSELSSVKTGYKSYASIITAVLLISGVALIYARPRRKHE